MCVGKSVSESSERVGLASSLVEETGSRGSSVMGVVYWLRALIFSCIYDG